MRGSLGTESRDAEQSRGEYETLARLSFPVFSSAAALLALISYPIVWLVSISFRLLGISVRRVFDLLDAIIRLPARAVPGNHQPERVPSRGRRGSVAARTEQMSSIG